MKIWENWPYWLRGGVKLIIIYTCFQIITVFLSSIKTSMMGYLLGVLINPSYWLYELIREFPALGFPRITNYFYIILGSLIIWFIVGAILGWLYGKIKNRKNNYAR